MVNIVFSEKKEKFQKNENKKIAKNEKIGYLESCDSHVVGYIWLYFPENRIYFPSDALFYCLWVSYPPVV